MKKPDISIIGTAARPENWIGLYRSLGSNDVSFEIVFVGPNKPDYELPPNFRFIRSNVKPMQCWEIAFQNTTGELIMNCIADDHTFVTPRPLDRLYETYKSYGNDKLILSCRYMINEEDVSEREQRFFVGDPESRILPMCALVARNLYLDTGGIDRNFIAVMGDLDVTMRMYSLGAEVILSDVFVNEDKARSRGSTLCTDYRGHDRALLDRLWTDGGKMRSTRAQPVEPFSDAGIMEKSQGPAGRWGHRSSVIAGLLTTSLFYRVNRAARIQRGRIRRFRFAKIPLYVSRLVRGR